MRPAQLTANSRASRRTALTNYLDLEEDRLLFEHLESFPAAPSAAATTTSPASSDSYRFAHDSEFEFPLRADVEDENDDLVAPPPPARNPSHRRPSAAAPGRTLSGVVPPLRARGIFEILQAKYGFQRASIANQKENFACWIANYQLRTNETHGGGDLYSALWRVHQKFFKNYRRWCAFLHATPRVAPEGAPSPLLEQQIALFLCLWGEAANLRFMPECICFLYHALAARLPELDTLPDVPEGQYLATVVRPLYEIIATMRTTAAASSAAKPIDHEDIVNYDDINEFFWTPACLDYDERTIAEILGAPKDLTAHKTFTERRSVFNPLLAFFRLWFFLLVAFHVLVVISYVGYHTRADGASGMAYYSNWFDADKSALRNHAILSVFVMVTALLTLKVVLQIWLCGMRLFKDVWFAIGVFLRLIWHTLFLAIFSLINVSPDAKFFVNLGFGGDTYLDMGGYMVLFYGIPVLIAALVRMFAVQGVWSIGILNSLDGTRWQYIGRDMTQPWRPVLLYSASWMIIYYLKFLFTLELMIKPLMGPTIEIYNTKVTEERRAEGIVESHHNLLFITALWAPVLVVYMYDPQIWFTLYQSIVGLAVGLMENMGHYTGIEQTKAALYGAPDLFDQNVASVRSQAQRVTPEGTAEESLRLRFAIIWNEIISSFRLNDLLDDRETVILQYRILEHGRKVENPIFLLAGKATKAIELATRARQDGWTTDELLLQLNKAGVMDGIQEALHLTRDIFHLLLRGGGEEDEESALTVFDYIFNVKDLVGGLDFTCLPALADNFVELLAVILDMPDDLAAVERNDTESQAARVAFHDQTRLVIEKLSVLFRNVELLINDHSITGGLRHCNFLKLTTELTFQKKQLLALYKADASSDSAQIATAGRRDNDSFVSVASSYKYIREDFISSCTRLFFLLRLDVSNSQPRCEDARRRLNFFLHSLTMTMPKVRSVEAMPSFSVMTPYYSETVLFTLDELRNPVNSNPLFERIDKKQKEKGRTDLTIMGYLITFHAEEWSNFLERMGVSTTEQALEHFPMQVRLWASLRGQTLARTVYGMMMYEDALRLLRWLELWNDELDDATKVNEMNKISALKFSYITGCQIYSQQVAKGDHRADDIDYLMKRFPSWRVSFVDEVKEYDGTNEIHRFDCVLVKAEGDEIVEVYRYELPGNPILGEGKPENQNVALPFTRGEYLQTIDMNQEHYFEETLKMPNFLATAADSTEDVTIIGMKEHVFTGRASSLARFMTLQELVFVTLTQRVLAKPLRSRMHYGHPDVFEKSFVMTNGGVSKASKGINLSEDVFSGYNVTLRGGLVTHVEFMQCGKGRDVTLSQINAFEAKLSNGCAESCLSREGHRLSNNLDFFRLQSMYYGHFGFYICNALTVLCVYIYAYAKLYVATHGDIIETAATNTEELDALAKVMSTQYILQFGLLTTLPLFSTLIVEFGWKQAVFQIFELISALGIVFYVFLTGTKAHYYDVALIRGGSKYRGTGRGFSITRDPMVNFFKEYGVSHFRKAVELIGVMILYGIYGNFQVGVGALDEFCATSDFDCEKRPDLIPKNITALEAYGSTPQSYGVASFAVLLLGACWLMAPFLFNTDGLVFEKTKIDVTYWFAWMMRVKCDEELIDEPDKSSGRGGTPTDGWIEWWEADVNLMSKVGPMGRLTYLFRELRHPMAMYFVFATQFKNAEWPLLVTVVLASWLLLWILSFVANQSVGKNQKKFALTLRGVVYMFVGLTSLGLGPMFIGMMLGWSALKGLTLAIAIFLGLNSICQYAIALHGIFGLPIAMWSPFMCLGFLYDMLVGLFLVVPLVLLSFLPFMRILQTRMMYNGGFARALASGSEVAASISILVGLMGGYVYGFMSCFLLSLGYTNEAKYKFINRSLINFAETLNNDTSVNLIAWLKNGQLKAVCSMTAVAMVLISIFLGKIIGRRSNMGLGCMFIAGGLFMNFVNVGVTVVTASCLMSAGTALIAVNYLLYSFEICTKGWRGKGMSMFLIGSMVGYVVHAAVHRNVNRSVYADGEGADDKRVDAWRIFPMYALLPVLPILILTLVYIPESPIWYLSQKDQATGKAILIRLRRRQNVGMEMSLVEAELKEGKKKRNLAFRVALAFALQCVLALMMSNALLLRENVREYNKDSGSVDASSWMVYFGVCNLCGLGFSVFLIDIVRRKTILKDFLPFMAAISLICGVVDTSVDGQNGVIQGLLFVLFSASGLSLQGVTWLSSLEMFGARNRPLFFSLSMAIYYAIQGLIFFFTPSFALSHFLFSGCCVTLTLLIFGLCASTKQGAIQLKSEKQRQKEQVETESPEEELRPSVVEADSELHEQQQQTRIAQIGQQNNAYARSHLSTVSSNVTGIINLNNLHLTSVTNGTQVTNLTNNGTMEPHVELAILNRRDPSTIESFNYSMTSEDYDCPPDLLLEEISHDIYQPRSLSFLQSRSFPDAQVQAETGGRGVRL